jgi:hypothetical protein
VTVDRIRVMISSRCNDSLRKANGKGSVKFTDLRLRAKKAIEAEQLFGRATFECWIHEDAPPLAGDGDAWSKCMQKVGDCHILLMLYNGNAGDGLDSRSVGICHAEMTAALESAPAKLHIVDVTAANVGRPTGDKDRNARFAQYVQDQHRPVRYAKSDEEALELLRLSVQDAVIDLTDRGASGLRTARYATGTPLGWSRLDYDHRRQAIEKILVQSLGGRDGDQGAVCNIQNVPVYFRCDAVPAAMSVAPARELVGRPFLLDHKQLGEMKGEIAGPVHVIGCHRTVTENQAINLLGFPDATVVTPEFGIYVADNVQKIQLIFLANCRDETTTRRAVERFQAWLLQSGEARYLAQRAQGRKAIVSAIATQQPKSAS